MQKEACGQAATCGAVDTLDRRIRDGLLLAQRDGCASGMASACLAVSKHGDQEALWRACDLADAEACRLACDGTSADAGGRVTDEERAAMDSKLGTNLVRCMWNKRDDAQACFALGAVVLRLSAGAPGAPPSVREGERSLYQTPLLADRPRRRYALDYFSRACFLGHRDACKELCSAEHWGLTPEESRECATVADKATMSALQTKCDRRNPYACYDLAVLYRHMGFFDRDADVHFIVGPGRVVGLLDRGCRLGLRKACKLRGEYGPPPM